MSKVEDRAAGVGQASHLIVLRRRRHCHLMRSAAPAALAPELHRAEQKIAMARIAQPLVLHDPRHAAVAAFDDHDMPLAEVAAAYLVRRKGDGALAHLRACRAGRSRWVAPADSRAA